MADTDRTTVDQLGEAQNLNGNDLLYIKHAAAGPDGRRDKKTPLSQVRDFVYPPVASVQRTGLVNIEPQAFAGKKTFRDGVSTSTIEASGHATFSDDTTVGGDLHVNGNIIQRGHSYETEVETLAVADQIIKTRRGATTGMSAGEFSGLQAHKYDGIHEGRIVFGADGVARVGDYMPASDDAPEFDDTQALATREENPTDGALQVWDDTNNRLKSIAKGTAGQVLTSNGPDADPEMKPLSGAVLAAHVEGTCSSAGNAEYKDVILTDYSDTLLPAEMTIHFTNKNTYGDTTLATPTYPKVRIYNSNNVLIATNNVCDSRGHVAGEGCWNAGDDIDFKNQNGKSRITNSDVRQANSNMTIKADGYSNYYKKGDTITLGPAPYSGLVTSGSASAYFFVPLPKKVKSTDTLTVTKCYGTVRSTLGYIDGTSGDIEYASSSYLIDVYYCYDNALQIRLQKLNKAPWSNVTNNTPICAWVALSISVT